MAKLKQIISQGILMNIRNLGLGHLLAKHLLLLWLEEAHEQTMLRPQEEL